MSGWNESKWTPVRPVSGLSLWTLSTGPDPCLVSGDSLPTGPIRVLVDVFPSTVCSPPRSWVPSWETRTLT